ncbi:prephenate dehydratase [Pullulanibacillus camelliae]|uniref:Prephenate dehydratase n=1 Tax=Pullulanibacillus camelliae TaxID=1707096 RepID=A0A8J2VK54_9BACL|nr:prephenate dehydratase [Pullulanibacillus camelliae]GGE33711.1 prephenate dehydratase [Pullulanibacillus camelliae]
MKVAYLGPKGTFSEEAAFRYFESDHPDWTMCDTIFDVLEAVKNNQVDQGIVPIENTIEGTINVTIDGLLSQGLHIEGELILPIGMYLLGAKDTKLENVKEIWSIPPALSQCQDYIHDLKAVVKHFNSTASAAKAVKESGRHDVAAIASEWAGQVFGLNILDRNIQDNLVNHTRFIVMTKEQKVNANASKTMLVVSPGEERPGVLSVILNVFSSLAINLTWIESRPTKKKLGTYRFFIEAELGAHEMNMKKAITILETLGHHARVLGSYSTTKL